MGNAFRVIVVVGCLFASLCTRAQVGDSTRQIVLPNPRLIHCRSVGCSQLWKHDPGDGRTVYPSQVLTDLVDGEVVALTAVYDKSISTQELRAAIDTLYAKSKVVQGSKLFVWCVEPERMAVQLADMGDGTNQVAYLKFGTTSSLVPAAHIFPTAETDCGKYVLRRARHGSAM